MVPGRTYEPEDILRIAWQRKWIIAAVSVVISVGAFLFGRSLPDRYRSEALIQVVRQRVSETYVRSTVTGGVEDWLQSLRQQTLNRSRIERIIGDFDLYPAERQHAVMEEIVERTRKDISVEIVKGDAFKISYTSTDPSKAMSVTERLASMIVDENSRDRESLVAGASHFFQSQLEEARQRLVEHEKKLEDYRLRYAGELPSQLDSNLQAVQNTQMQLQALNESINRDQDRRLALERSVRNAAVPPPVPLQAHPPLQQIDLSAVIPGRAAEQLAAATKALAAMQLRLTSQHPDVISMNSLIRELEARAASEAAETRNQPAPPVTPAEASRQELLQGLQAKLENLDRQIAHKTEEEARLRTVIAGYQARAEASPTRESELTALTRDYDTLQKVYTGLLSKREDSNIAANLERQQIGDQFKILDPARMPEKPVGPNRALIDLFGVLFGVGAGLGLVTLLEYFDSTIRSDEEVLSAFGLPVLAMVPVIGRGRSRRAVRKGPASLGVSQ